MAELNYKKGLTIVFTGLLVLLLVSGIPVWADDESTTDAQVEVLPEETGSYGAWVIKSQLTLFPSSALGKPDAQGAIILWNGWISIKLEDKELDVHKISIWADNNGWWNSLVGMKIYVSADGSKWTKVGEKYISGSFLRYDFTGSFGNVRYIKVSRASWQWSILRLDAVYAEGGDELGVKNQSKNGNFK